MSRGRPDYGLLTIPTILQNVTEESVVGPLGSSFVDHSTVGLTKYRYYLSASMSQSGLTPCYASIMLIQGSFTGVQLIRSEVLYGSATGFVPDRLKGQRWALRSSVGGGSQATVTRPAASGFLHVCETISFSARASGAPVATALDLNLIDGPSGGASVLWTQQLFIANAVGQSVAPFTAPGLYIAGSNNTAMTLEFSASLASLGECVDLTGYDIVNTVPPNSIPSVAIARPVIVPPGAHLRFLVDAIDAGGKIDAEANYVELDFTSEIPNL